MSKRKPSPQKPKAPTPAGDRHRSGFMIRLPEWHRAVLASLKKKNRRKFTEEVQIALEDHYKKEGVEIPPNTST